MGRGLRRPVIGICAAIERARWGAWDQDAALLPLSYVDAVQRAGGVVLILPPDEALLEDAGDVLRLLDGLMLAGGADIDPASYGRQPEPHTTGTVRERDDWEIAITRAAIERDVPVLGICRGMQLINVACGGTLVQHLPDHVGHEEHRRVLGSFDGADHDVQLSEGSLAALAAGEVDHATKSHHHQGVGRLGDGLVVSGFSTLDEVPEAIESPERRYVLGVQWHPEYKVLENLVSAALFSAFGQACRAASESPGLAVRAA
jgi:putative glutamine amidotransferase